MTLGRTGIEDRLFERAREWLEGSLGDKFPSPGTTGTHVFGRPDAGDRPTLIAVRRDATSIVATREEWLADVRELAERMHPDLLFSVVGAYELSRITLPDGFAAWGPVPCYLADKEVWRPTETRRVVRLSEEQHSAVDWKVFWHCDRSPGSISFGVFENDRLLALASAAGRARGVFEIGVDVHPGAKGQGLGSRVVSAAGNWILERGGVVFASAALWNVPSGRTLRRLGLHYVYSVMLSRRGPFLVQPQPLGVPIPGEPIYDNYPRWAMNDEIRERESAP